MIAAIQRRVLQNSGTAASALAPATAFGLAAADVGSAAEALSPLSAIRAAPLLLSPTSSSLQTAALLLLLLLLLLLVLLLVQTVLGVSLGAACTLTMTPGGGFVELPGGRAVEVILPRRSIYILSDRARYSPGWMRGIKAVGTGQAVSLGV